MKIAIVFGFSEQGEYLAKRLILSFYEHVLKRSSSSCEIHVFPYKCNFAINNMKEFSPGMNRQECEAGGFDYLPFSKGIDWSEVPNSFQVHPIDCSDSSFVRFFLPDVAVYHDFAVNFSRDYDFVLYCHDDVIFKAAKTSLDDWTSVLDWDTEYSIIAELRATANYEISLRFHMCFVFVNVSKFFESSLSFMNDLVLMDGNKFKVYGNGGTGLLASVYAKKKGKPLWRPYIIDVHGVYRGIEITSEDKWFDHPGEIEWNRSQLLSEGSLLGKTEREYQNAKEYVQSYVRRYDLSD